MKRIVYTLSALFYFGFLLPAMAQVQSPDQFFNREYGSWMPYYYEIMAYFDHLAEKDSRVFKETYGKTYEGRDLNVYYFGQNVDSLKISDLKDLRREASQQKTQENLLIWLSFGVHGNEVGATISAPLTAYKILTSEHDLCPENTLIIIDPVVNPDGYQRYIQWYNQTRANVPNVNPKDIEHREIWPTGRGNHYHFDLNRDMAWASQVESKRRIAIYQSWLPHIHVDFHEQLPEDPYFFPPAAEPIHPLISDWQRKIQTEIGEENAAVFDANKWSYFTREYFDLYYPGYGDTYPLFNGAVGMTYEQGGHGIAGLQYLLPDGDTLSLSDRINHHSTAGINTIMASLDRKSELLGNQAEFFRGKTELKHDYTSYLIPNLDEKQANDIADFLNLHQIRFNCGYFNGPCEAFSITQEKNTSIDCEGLAVEIPLQQWRATLIEVLFNPDYGMSENLSYDLTAWAMPFALGVECLALNSEIALNKVGKNTISDEQTGSIPVEAIALHIDSVKSPFAPVALHKAGVPFYRATRNSVYDGHSVSIGDLIIFESAIATMNMQWRREFMRRFNTRWITSGFSSEGVDLGSDKYQFSHKPHVACIFEKKSNAESVGFVWYFFEQELDYPLARLGKSDFFERKEEYNVLILTKGNYAFDEKERKEIIDWISTGGKLILTGEACKEFAAMEDFALEFVQSDESQESQEPISPEEVLTYEEKQGSHGNDFMSGTSGAIVRTALDETHPIALGLGNTYYSLKSHARVYQLSSEIHNLSYLDSQYKHFGLLGKNLQEKLQSSLVIGVENKGMGKVIYFTDDPLFRGFWDSGERLFYNAIFNF